MKDSKNLLGNTTDPFSKNNEMGDKMQDIF